MAGHWRYQPTQPVQVCSIDTIYRRKLLPKADLIIIDEAQDATSEGYHWLANAYPDAYFLPVTATPYCIKSLEHVAQKIIRPITFKELIEQNYLVAPKYYAPSIPDLTGVKTKQGDFDVFQLDEILNQSHPIGDIVSSWKNLANGRPSIAFAVSIKHSLSIAAAFNASGIPAIHIEASHSDKEREEAIKRLESGEIKVISNVGILCVGVDIPSISCVIMARPTKSYSLFIQQAGRGSRIYPGKSDFLILDHGGNTLRHGLITEDREGSILPIPKSKNKEPSIKTCEDCYAVYSVHSKSCPECGTENEAAKNSREDKAANPITAGIEDADLFHLQIIARRATLRDIQKRKNYKRGWVWHQLKEIFGEDIATKYEPKRKVPDWIYRSTSKAST